MQPHWLYHMHVQNDMETTVSRLNLRSVWESLEPGQEDLVSLEPGASVEFKCNDPNPHLFRKRFSAAVSAAGGDPTLVWFKPVSEVDPPAEE